MYGSECWKIVQEIANRIKVLSASYGEFITTKSAAQSAILGHIGWIPRTLAIVLPDGTLPFVAILTHWWFCVTLKDRKTQRSHCVRQLLLTNQCKHVTF